MMFENPPPDSANAGQDQASDTTTTARGCYGTCGVT
jgi:hypothetical protein